MSKLWRYLKAIPAAYARDGLVTVHNHEFLDDPAFRSAYARGVAAAGRDYGWQWRVHVGLWAAGIGAKLPGDFVECGVNAGFMSSSVMSHLGWNGLGKTFYLLDTFAGLDERYVSEAERAAGALDRNREHIEEGFYVVGVEAVRRNFAEWDRVRIIQGSIPETLPAVDAEAIAFLHVDLNCAPPEVAAVEHFWERLSRGAPILLDDYAYYGFREQKLAMDALAKRLGTSVVSLPTGQGMMIKA